MKLLDNQQFNFGVYGICTKGDEVLVIKKVVDPTKGCTIFPGGQVEFDELVETALKREYEEEIGVEITAVKFIGYNEYFCKFTNDLGEEKDFHHVGLYFTVGCDTATIKKDADGHDSLGAVFIPKKELGLHNCSQIALEMVHKVTK